MKRLALLVIMLIWCIDVARCQEVEITNYLQDVMQTSDLIIQDEKATLLDGKPYKLSPFRRIQFRTENDELAEEQQEYALRVNATNPFYIKRNNDLFLEEYKALNLERQVALKTILKEKYHLVVDFCVLSTRLSYEEQLLELAKQQEKLLLAEAETNRLNTDKLLDNKLEQIEQLEKVEELKSRLNLLSQKMGLINSGQSNWKVTDLIPADSLIKVATKLQNSVYSAPELALKRHKINQLNQEIKLENTLDNLGFLQTDYYPHRTEKNKVGLSVGITLPIVNNNKPDVTERKLDLIEEQHELAAEELELQQKQKMAFDKLKSDCERYTSFKKQISDILSDDILKAYQKEQDQDPFKILKINRGKLKLDIKLLDHQEQIYRSYIVFLSCHNLLQQQPLKNYLATY